MKRFVLFLCLPLCLLGCASYPEPEEPYNRTGYADDYENMLRKHVFAACSGIGQFDATYALAQMNAKPTDCDPRYKVTFVNGPCKGRTVWTEDVITKTEPVAEAELIKGQIVLRDFWNPKKGRPTLEEANRWNRGIVYDTSRLDKGIVILEYPHDQNDFMAQREYVFVRNVRVIREPKQKPLRTWL